MNNYTSAQALIEDARNRISIERKYFGFLAKTENEAVEVSEKHNKILAILKTAHEAIEALNR